MVQDVKATISKARGLGDEKGDDEKGGGGIIS
jgi:hypothetical protein